MGKHNAHHTRAKSRAAEEDARVFEFLAHLGGVAFVPPTPEEKRRGELNSFKRSLIMELADGDNELEDDRD